MEFVADMTLHGVDSSCITFPGSCLSVTQTVVPLARGFRTLVLCRLSNLLLWSSISSDRFFCLQY